MLNKKKKSFQNNNHNKTTKKQTLSKALSFISIFFENIVYFIIKFIAQF